MKNVLAVFTYSFPLLLFKTYSPEPVIFELQN
jgi:hypothetical protein